jgi:hypothetical protein
MMKISRSILIIAFLFSGLIFTITLSRTDTSVDASAGEFITLPKQVEPSKNQITAYLSETSEPNAIYSSTTAADVNTGSWHCWDWDDGTPDPCHHLLHSIDMVTATDGWAVGFNGVILRWEETQWTKHESPTDRWLYAVDMVSPLCQYRVGHSKPRI